MTRTLNIPSRQPLQNFLRQFDHALIEDEHQRSLGELADLKRSVADLRQSVAGLQSQITTLAADNRRLREQLAALETAAATPVEDRDAFIREFGTDHGNFMHDAGWSLDLSRRVYAHALKSGGDLRRSRMCLAAEDRPISN